MPRPGCPLIDTSSPDGAKFTRPGPKTPGMVRDMLLHAEASAVLAHCEAGCCPAPQRPAVARP